MDIPKDLLAGFDPAEIVEDGDMGEDEAAASSEDEIEASTDRVLAKIAEDKSAKFRDLNGMLAQLKDYPVIKKRELYAPLFAASRAGSRQARDQLVYGNIRLAVWMAYRYSHGSHGISVLDLVQEGVVGLMRAIEKFEPERGFAFSTYATPWVRQAITRAIKDKATGNAFRIPVHMEESMDTVGKAVSIFHAKNGRWGSEVDLLFLIRSFDTEAAKRMSLWKVHLCLVYMRTGVWELDAKVGPAGGNEDDESRNEVTVIGPQKTIETFVLAEQLLAKYRAALARVEAVIGSFPPREVEIFRLRHGLGEFESMTLEEVGAKFALTRERTRQLEAKVARQIFAALGVTEREFARIIEVIDELERVVNSL